MKKLLITTMLMSSMTVAYAETRIGIVKHVQEIAVANSQQCDDYSEQMRRQQQQRQQQIMSSNVMQGMGMQGRSSGPVPLPPDPNLPGGSFMGGTTDTVISGARNGSVGRPQFTQQNQQLMQQVIGAIQLRGRVNTNQPTCRNTQSYNDQLYRITVNVDGQLHKLTTRNHYYPGDQVRVDTRIELDE